MGTRVYKSAGPVQAQPCGGQFVDTVTSMFPASSDHLEEYQTAQKTDPTRSMIQHYCEIWMAT